MRDVYGKILQEEVKKEGMPTVTDFANMLGISVKTLYNVFNGSSELTLSQLVKASEILKTNLVKRFSDLEGGMFSEPDEEYLVRKNSFSLTLNLKGSMSAVANLPMLLINIKSVALEQGFKLV